MKRPEALSLLLIVAVVGIFMAPAWATCSGCGCYTWYPTEAEKQQFLWMKEAACFLYSDDCCYATVAPHYVSTTAGLSASISASTSASVLQPFGNDTAEYYLNKANEFYLTGSYEQAAELYAKAVEIDPSLQNGWLNMGNALFFMRRYEESLNAYNSVLNLNPQNENALLGKSEALSALNRTDEANAAMNVVKKLQDRKIAELGGLKSTTGAVEPVVVGSH